MDTLFHLVFGFIAGMAINVKLKHKPFWVFGVALAAVFIDIDHLLFAYARSFHNVFFVFLLPLLLFAVAYRYERKTDSIKYQSLSLLLFVLLVGHLVADSLSGGVLRLFYPLSDQVFAVPASWRVTVIQENWAIISPEGISLAVYGVIVGLTYYIEEVIYFVEAQHETMREACSDAFRA